MAISFLNTTALPVLSMLSVALPAFLNTAAAASGVYELNGNAALFAFFTIAVHQLVIQHYRLSLTLQQLPVVSVSCLLNGNAALLTFFTIAVY